MFTLPSTDVIIALLSLLSFVIDIVRRVFAAYGTLIEERSEALLRAGELSNELEECRARYDALQQAHTALQERYALSEALVAKRRRLSLWRLRSN